jgi:hypothetical protein
LKSQNFINKNYKQSLKTSKKYGEERKEDRFFSQNRKIYRYADANDGNEYDPAINGDNRTHATASRSLSISFLFSSASSVSSDPFISHKTVEFSLYFASNPPASSVTSSPFTDIDDEEKAVDAFYVEEEEN